MRTVTVRQTTETTIQVPDLYDMSIGLTDSGPGGDPPNRGVITVDGVQLCYADELSAAGLAAFQVLRAEVYAKRLTQLGVTP